MLKYFVDKQFRMTNRNEDVNDVNSPVQTRNQKWVMPNYKWMLIE